MLLVFAPGSIVYWVFISPSLERSAESSENGVAVPEPDNGTIATWVLSIRLPTFSILEAYPTAESSSG